MEKIEKTLKYTKLFNLYGALLSDAQKAIFEDYYFADLSISEISENRSISRAAVEDALNKSVRKLDDYENKLKIMSRDANLRAKLIELLQIVDKNEEKELLQEVLEELENGIWKSYRKDIKNI